MGGLSVSQLIISNPLHPFCHELDRLHHCWFLQNSHGTAGFGNNIFWRWNGVTPTSSPIRKRATILCAVWATTFDSFPKGLPGSIPVKLVPEGKAALNGKNIKVELAVPTGDDQTCFGCTSALLIRLPILISHLLQ